MAPDAPSGPCVADAGSAWWQAFIRPPGSLAAASSESEGIRALHLGDPAAAARSFAEAGDAWAPFHVPRELICRWAHGEALRRAGSTEAPALLRNALDRAEGHGFGSIAARVRRSLRQAGVRVAPPRTGTDVDRWARMTGREREVLQLVGRGMTTPQIARRMGLGRGTVDQVLGAAIRRAIDEVRRLQPALLLLLDIQLPRVSGFESPSAWRSSTQVRP